MYLCVWFVCLCAAMSGIGGCEQMFSFLTEFRYDAPRWLSHWSDVLATAPYGTTPSTLKYLGLYLMFNLMNGAAVFGRTLALVLGGMQSKFASK